MYKQNKNLVLVTAHRAFNVEWQRSLWVILVGTTFSDKL